MTTMSRNIALEDGGGIYATMTTILNLRHSSIMLNNATISGGGIALLFGSLLNCFNCTIDNNIAKRGGGCYIETNAQQNAIVEMTSSRFEGNNAQKYGGNLI